MLIAAGILNSPKDCKTPAVENTIPLSIKIGKNIFKSCAVSNFVCKSKPLANKFTIGMEKIVDKKIIIAVNKIIKLKKLLNNLKAESLPFFSRQLLKIGIKLDVIDDANIISRN